ncbi:MAG: ATPase P [Desulfobacteraceae bacterium]|nr:ATPase P [Desulfobacteraceae bacterium]
MIRIDIPGYRLLNMHHLVLDYNGTLACDGTLIGGVRPALIQLAEKLDVHVITADTFGQAKSGLEGIPCHLSILPPDNQAQGKLAYIHHLGREGTVAIGNGRNDRLMLKDAILGIAVVLGEGAAVESLVDADIVTTSIVSALELLQFPLRLTATLRS